ncbi:MAG: hypothetical protein ABSF98_29490 [Bryobacteraceae bacterium]|jgi:hypothetical protein
MTQALHILRKDARRFAYEICVLAALTSAFAWSQIGNDVYTNGALSGYLRLASAILPIGWWYVISLLIHEESLIGDRQFWITRPYSRWSLLAAKSLFVALFVNVPLLLAGFAILAVWGFQPLAYLPQFLWMQLVLAAALILPPLALASLTRTLAQFGLTILGLLAGYAGLMLVFGDSFVEQGFHRVYWSNGLAWADSFVGTLLVAAPALLMLLLEWGTRKRWIAVGAGTALFALLYITQASLGWRLGTEVQSRMFGVGGGASTAVTLNAADVTPDSWAGALGLRAMNIPPGETVAPEILQLTFEGRDGARWSTGWTPAISSESDVVQTNPASGGAFVWWQRVVVERGFYERARRSPVTIRGNVYLMLNARRAVSLPENRATAVPGGGVCFVSVSRPRRVRVWFVNCRAPFHEPFNTSDSFWDLPGRAIRLLSFWDSPLPVNFGLSPLSINQSPNGTDTANTNSAGAETEFFFLRYEPRAYIRRSFEAANVRLP